MPEKELDLAKRGFIKYLDILGLSPKSHKNYRSDLTHFMGWAIMKIRSIGSYVESLSEIVPFLNTSLCAEYKTYMAVNNAPPKTVNRRLATLRHLAKFLTATQLVESDFMTSIDNVSLNPDKKPVADPVISDFRAFLETEKVSQNTIKNYLSDIKQFLSWIENNNQTLNSKP